MKCPSTRRPAVFGQKITLRYTTQSTYLTVDQVNTLPLHPICTLCALLGFSLWLHICPEFVTLVCFWLAARAYWCFGFEAKNQEVKVAAEASNYKSVLKSVTSTLSLQSARSLRKRKRGLVVDGILLWIARSLYLRTARIVAKYLQILAWYCCVLASYSLPGVFG